MPQEGVVPVALGHAGGIGPGRKEGKRLRGLPGGLEQFAWKLKDGKEFGWVAEGEAELGLPGVFCLRSGGWQRRADC